MSGLAILQSQCSIEMPWTLHEHRNTMQDVDYMFRSDLQEGQYLK